VIGERADWPGEVTGGPAAILHAATDDVLIPGRSTRMS
jgi:hypothetical protein